MGESERPGRRPPRGYEITLSAETHGRLLKLARTSEGLSLRRVSIVTGIRETRLWEIENSLARWDITVSELRTLAELYRQPTLLRLAEEMAKDAANGAGETAAG